MESSDPYKAVVRATEEVQVGAEAPTDQPQLIVAGGEPRTGEFALADDDDGVPPFRFERKPWMPPDYSGGVLDDRYRLIAQLGFGRMGTVYEAEHITIQKRVAVKILNPDYADDPEIAGRFLQGARTTSRLRHKHIVDITDFGDTEGSVYFAMELLEGESLSTTLLEGGPLHYPRVTAMAEQICDALATVHKIGVIHHDIKPAKCFRLTRGGNPDFIKLLSLGTPKFATDTPGYMALELLKGEAYDHRIDIYALGVLMYKLLTNKMPFPALNAYGTLARQLDDKPVPLRNAAPGRGVPEILEALIHKALARDPERRFQSALEFGDALRATAASFPSGSRLPRDPRDWGGAEAALLATTPELSVPARVTPTNTDAEGRRGLVPTVVAPSVGAVAPSSRVSVTRPTRDEARASVAVPLWRRPLSPRVIRGLGLAFVVAGLWLPWAVWSAGWLDPL